MTGGGIMYRDNDKVRALYQKLQSKNLTRTERKNIMEEIYRERYKSDPRKSISQKGQAVCNAICGLLIMVCAIVNVLIKGKALSDNYTFYRTIANLVFATALGAAFVMLVIQTRRKNEPADELSKELMFKATSYAGAVPMVVVWLVGLIMTIISDSRDSEFFSVNSDDIMALMLLMLGSYLTAKNAIYLWLDRTPISDDEED